MDYARTIAKIKAADTATLEAMRRAILAGDCPFCDRTECRVVATHIQMKHGVTRRELSDLLGFTYSERICSPEHSAKHSAILKPLGFVGTPNTKGATNPAPLSKRAREKMREWGKRARERNTDEFFLKEFPRIGHEALKIALQKKRLTRTPRHGTMNEYRKYGCRCDLCKEACLARSRANRQKFGSAYFLEKARQGRERNKAPES